MNKGRIVQVMGPVVDVVFENGDLPFIKDALEVENNGKKCIMEVAQHLGNNEVRCLMLAASEQVSPALGCPRHFTVEVHLPEAAPVIEYTLQWFDKAACRLPEALWLSFNPRVPSPSRWTMDKLGQAISPLDVVLDGNRHLHGIGEGVRYAVASVQPGMKLSFAAEGTNDPYAGFEARIVPENVTMLPKTGEQAKGGNPVNEIVHIVKKGENLASILRKEGASAEEIRAIAIALGNFGREDKLKEGLKLRILMSPIDSGAKLHPVRVIVMDDTTIEAVAAYSDLGKYVAVDVASLNETSQTADNASSEDKIREEMASWYADKKGQK